MEAEHAAEALIHLTSPHGVIRVLFTDIHMPGAMNGLELAHYARRHWPWIALLVTSGRARPNPTDMPAGCHFLAKPYGTDHLVAHVRQLVAA